MATVGKTSSDGLYTLGNQTQQAKKSTTVTSADNAATEVSAGTKTEKKSRSGRLSNSAYALSLSNKAQTYLETTTGQSSRSISSTKTQSFQLNSSQRKRLDAIIYQYKDAPYTEATFKSIQNDLKKSGLDTGTLSLLSSTKRANNTSVLLAALNGTAAPATAGANNETKSENYIQNVLDQWTHISSTYKPS